MAKKKFGCDHQVLVTQKSSAMVKVWRVSCGEVEVIEHAKVVPVFESYNATPRCLHAVVSAKVGRLVDGVRCPDCEPLIEGPVS